MLAEPTDTVPAEVSLRLAERLADALTTNDIEALRRNVYAPDVVVWHNNDQREQSLDENLRTLGWLHKAIADQRYENVVRQPTPTGFVEQHVLRGTTRSGAPIDLHACLVVTVVAGRISRVDEYLDSAAVAALAS